MLVPPTPVNDFSTGCVMAHIMPPRRRPGSVTTVTIKASLTKLT